MQVPDPVSQNKSKRERGVGKDRARLRLREPRNKMGPGESDLRT